MFPKIPNRNALNYFPDFCGAIRNEAEAAMPEAMRRQEPTKTTHMTQTLIDAAKQCPGMVVSIKVGDLIEANTLLIENVKSQLEQKIADASAETYLSKEKVCEMLDVSTTTLWRWEKAGYLVPVAFGGQKRYKKSDVQRIIEGE